MHARSPSMAALPAATLALLCLAAPALANTPEGHADQPAGRPFGSSGRYDATGSDFVKGMHLDHAFIRGLRDTTADGRHLAGAPVTQVRRNYVYVEDVDGSLHIPYREGQQQQQDILDSFNFVLREVYRVLPDEFLFVYMFNSFDSNVPMFFYMPEASSERGIHQPAGDTNGDSPREGIVFMNYWQDFQNIFGGGGPAVVQGQARSVFNQEAGHRWCCFVVAGPGRNGTGANVLLGRDDSHWSYFLETGGSPMEGNHWVDNHDGTFTTATGFQNWRYSPLDLYLMGLIPPSEVPPFFVINNPITTGKRDLFNDLLSKASTPQIIEPMRVSGTRVDMTIDTIVTNNGVRSPAAGAAPNRYRVVFVMLAGRSSSLNESQRTLFEDMVDGYAAGFKEGTGNRADFDYALNATPRQPMGGVCQQTPDCDPLQATVCLVVPPVQAGSGLCTHACTPGGSTCPDGWCCEAASSGVSVCLPSDLCPQPSAPDAGVVDSGPAPCDCDKTYSCDKNEAGDGQCTCDPDCACDCDKTYSCDRNAAGDGQCTCDPDCKGAEGAKSGCTCVASEAPAAPERGTETPAGLALVGLGIALAVGLRRRSRA